MNYKVAVTIMVTISCIFFTPYNNNKVLYTGDIILRSILMSCLSIYILDKYEKNQNK